MTIIKTFTDGADAFAASTDQVYQLDFLGGDDALRVIRGTTTAHMGAGNDRVRVDGGSATIFGDDGADRIDLFSAATVDGGAGNDRFNIRGGSNHVVDGAIGDDTFVFYGAVTGEDLSGGEGNDRFLANGVTVSGEIDGGAGNDLFYGFAGSQVRLAGGAGDDVYRVLSASGPEIVENAGEGKDTVQVARGISFTLGDNLENLRVADGLGSGEDATLTGNALANLITGSSGRDSMYGMDGNDVLLGGAGNDTIDAGAGNDRVVGGLGFDLLYGGAGSDVFTYNSVAESSSSQWDEIDDFDLSHDRIDLSAIDADTTMPGKQDFVWGGTGVGHLQTGTFIGTDLVADTNGDGQWDLYIYLGDLFEGYNNLTERNFIL